MHTGLLSSDRRILGVVFRSYLNQLEACETAEEREELLVTATGNVATFFRDNCLPEALPRELKKFVKGYAHGLSYRYTTGALDSEAELQRVLREVGARSAEIR